MSIPSTLAAMPAIAGDGATTVHSYTFKILDEDDLKIVLVDASGDATTLIKTTHYAVTGVGTDGGGTVVMITPHAATEELHILLDTEFTQLVNFQAEEYDNAFDRLTLMAKTIKRLVGNALRVSETSGLPASSLIVTPTPSTFIGFDGDGNAASLTLADLGDANIIEYPLVLAGDTLSLDAIIPKNKTDASAPPTANNDTTQGYTVLSRWSGTSLGDVYVCQDPAEGAAVWKKVTGDLAALDTVGESEIEDDAVTLAKMANGTAGDIYYCAATGTPTYLGKGTTGQTLKQGADYPEWGPGVDSEQLCTAWITFNGTGTIAILDSYNISSITDNAVGNYTVNLATTLANSNYAVVPGGKYDPSVVDATGDEGMVKPNSLTTSSFGLRCQLHVTGVYNAYRDYEYVSAVVFGGN